MTLKLTLLGKNGQVGWELHRTLISLGELTALDYPEVDFSQPDSLRDTVSFAKPDIIINASAYTAVDQAESEQDLAYKINAAAPRVLAEIAKQHRAVLIHFSTDYVYDGKKGSAYTEEDSPNPINVYGASKLEGDRAIQDLNGCYLILRTSWVYSLRRDSFVTKVLKWARANSELRIVADQVGSPTWARSLAEIVALLIARGGRDPIKMVAGRAGVYHLAGDGGTSRHEWAQVILENDPNKDKQIVEKVIATTTDEFPTPAKRPLFTALNCDRFERAFDLHLPDWKTSLRLAMGQIE